MRYPSIGAALALVVLVAAPAAAQQPVEITAPRPVPERVVVPPGDHYEVTRPSDAEYYAPQGPRVRHDPAFVGPLSAKTQSPTSTGRVGVAGWTSPNTPVGAVAGYTRENPGWFALGFAIEWGGPPPAKRPTVR